MQPDQTFLFTCLNDKIDHSLKSAEIVENDVKVNFYEKIFPKISKFEIEHEASEEPSAAIELTSTEKTVEATTEEAATFETTSEPTYDQEPEIVIKKDQYDLEMQSDKYEDSIIDIDVIDYSCQSANWYNVIAMYLCGTTVFILLLLKLKRYSFLKF